MSSRLFQEVREKRGLAYSIYSFHWPYFDTGLFGFYAASGGRMLAELVRCAWIAWRRRRKISTKPRSRAPRRR